MKYKRPFVWGSATSAFQIEGAANKDGRGPSIWDEFCARPGVIADGSNGAVACNHYERLEEDLDLMDSLHLQAYRFSVSWSRIQPDGKGRLNEKGLDFYERLIDGLCQRGILPFMTLYHWDLPLALQDDGGWMNRDTCDRFVQYADLLGSRFGDRLASICTFNEPWVIATLGHEQGIFAPGIQSRKTAMQVSHHLLLSHGMALRQLRQSAPNCDIGLVLNQGPVYPLTQDASAANKARLEDGLLIRWYMDPLFKGTYPEDVWEHLGAEAPTVRAGDMELIRAPMDYLGINYYTVNRVGAAGERTDVHPDVLTDMGWEICPDGLRDLLERLHREYPIPPIYITENGAAFADQVTDGRVHDARRIRYIHSHLQAMFQAMQSGVDVRGYFLWSLFDNFEWAHGYSKRFGMVYVDYPTQQRLLKDSALWYRQLIESARSGEEKEFLASQPLEALS